MSRINKLSSNNWFSFLVNPQAYHFPGMLISVSTMGILTSIFAVMILELEWFSINVPPSFHTVLGLVIGMLLVFRTNTAYDRWWEGRKQLGSLVNTCRSLAVLIQTATEGEGECRAAFKVLIPAFSWATKEHLRNHSFDDADEHLTEAMLKEFKDAEHKPLFVLSALAKYSKRLEEEQRISPQTRLIIQEQIVALSNILGACERIRNTPIPMGYSLHLKRILLMYISSLPFSFIHDLNWWAVPVTMVVFYTMVGIELIGEEIEDPFGEDPNDLPFNSLDAKIRANILEVLK